MSDLVRGAGLDALLHVLFAHEGGPTLFNPWHGTTVDDVGTRAWVARRARLRRHLAAARPRLLLVGSAATYEACRISGVPFTSERLVLEGRVPRMGRVPARLSTQAVAWSERPSTAVWRALHALGLAETTLLWTVVPWHPWQYAVGPLSDRPPTRREREAGLAVLQRLLQVLPETVRPIALGRIAAGALARVSHTPFAILHAPTSDSAKQFRVALEAAVRSTGA